MLDLAGHTSMLLVLKHPEPVCWFEQLHIVNLPERCPIAMLQAI